MGLCIKTGFYDCHGHCPDCGWHGRVRIPTANFASHKRANLELLTPDPKLVPLAQKLLIDKHQEYRREPFDHPHPGFNCSVALLLAGPPKWWQRLLQDWPSQLFFDYTLAVRVDIETHEVAFSAR